MLALEALDVILTRISASQIWPSTRYQFASSHSHCIAFCSVCGGAHAHRNHIKTSTRFHMPDSPLFRSKQNRYRKFANERLRSADFVENVNQKQLYHRIDMKRPRKQMENRAKEMNIAQKF